MGYECKIIEDSVAPHGGRLTTFIITFPRIVLAEFNTHRMLSRNSASSRAIPVAKRIAAVELDPFIPDQFGMNRPGMQAGPNIDERQAKEAEQVWLRAASAALQQASALAELGVHKQLANRLLEPFSWHTVIVTATEWDNFFALRCHPDAQPEIRRIAEMMAEAYVAGKPRKLYVGEWHLPLVTEEEREAGSSSWGDVLPMLSAGRCARVSYLTHEGKRDVDADFALAERLLSSGHMSPFEHQAEVAADGTEKSGNFVGFKQRRKSLLYEANFARVLQNRDWEAREARKQAGEEVTHILDESSSSFVLTRGRAARKRKLREARIALGLEKEGSAAPAEGSA